MASAARSGGLVLNFCAAEVSTSRKEIFSDPLAPNGSAAPIVSTKKLVTAIAASFSSVARAAERMLMTVATDMAANTLTIAATCKRRRSTNRCV